MTDKLATLKDRLDRARAQVFAKRVAHEQAVATLDEAKAKLMQLGFETDDFSTLDEQLAVITAKEDTDVAALEAALVTLEEQLGPSKF